MKFEVRKENVSWESKPCDEAIQEFRPNIDVRRADSPYKIWKTEEEVQREWFGKGINHRTKNGKIIRDLEDYFYWVVEFTTLEEFLQFQEKHYLIEICNNSLSGYKLIKIKE